MGKLEQLILIYGKKHRQGKLKRKESLKLAEEFLKEKKYGMAHVLYHENIKEIKNTSPEVLMNYAISLAKTEHTKEALKVFSQVSKKLENKKYQYLSLKDLRQNVLLALKNQKNQKNQKKGSSSGTNNQCPDESPCGGQGGGKKMDKQGEAQERKNQISKESTQSLEKRSNERENEITKKRRKVKIPALLKQILDNDRILQKKFMKTSTQNKNHQNRKDW